MFTTIYDYLTYRFNKIILPLEINKKWNTDKQTLPLSQAHKELYNIIHKRYFKELGEFPNLIDCRDFNDKIQWLKLFDQDELLIQCSDKIHARDYIKCKVGEEYLPTLHQIASEYSSIDFQLLPQSFVIKTNHDCGTVIIINDKSKINHQSTEGIINRALKKAYGWSNGEWPYAFIRPKILIEEYIKFNEHINPPDYKFHCSNGELNWLHFIYDREHDAKEVIVDPEGNLMNVGLYHGMKRASDFHIPKNWDLMKEIAKKLAAPFKYVRVDLYNVDGRILVGELTFFPFMGCYKGIGQKKLGQLVNFDRTTFKPPIYNRKKL